MIFYTIYVFPNNFPYFILLDPSLLSANGWDYGIEAGNDINGAATLKYGVLGTPLQLSIVAYGM